VRCTEMCPTTLQEAKPKAGSSPGTNECPDGGPQTGAEAQKSTPSASPADRFCRSRFRRLQQAVGHPDENQSGRTQGHRTTRGPGPAEMPKRQVDRRELVACQAATIVWRERPPVSGIKPAKGLVEPHERRRATAKQEGKVCVARPGSAAARTGSGTPREEGAIWRMTRLGRAESQRRRFQWYGSRASVTT
jgi:hypothetical protein